MAPFPSAKKRKLTATTSKTGKIMRSKPTKIEELKFDPEARQDYLTGFHKRKVQRIKHAQEEAAKKGKEEKVEARKEV